jgi:3-hydroxyisobutyrate dehydrogenase-like beta-hydroxyacid dehydrogenase
MSTPNIQKIALIGFGEAGGILGHDFAKRGLTVFAFDILFDSSKTRDAMLAKTREYRVEASASVTDCVRDADLVISAVTASSALDVAREVSPALPAEKCFLDINSVSPGTKRQIAAQFVRSQGRFVESAVMASVPGLRLKVPMLLGGAHATELAAALNAIGMNAKPASDKIGVASAVKMCRSVVIKGIEALAVESMFAARRYGAEQAVLESLAATYPNMGWEKSLPDYLISRVAEHGKRRAAEMRESAQALRDVGIDPLMAEATAKRQDNLASEMLAQKVAYDKTKEFSWRDLADALALSEKSGKTR